MTDGVIPMNARDSAIAAGAVAGWYFYVWMADLFVVVALVRDWRITGRPHPVYVYGGAVLLAQQVLTVPFAATATWMGIVHAFESLAG